jgi:KDO2-lipid IV(A) lauroyltransferase
MKRWTAYGLGILTRLLAVCPWSWRRPIASVMAWTTAKLRLRSALVTRRNLERCYPGLEQDALDARVQASLTETSLLLLETGKNFHASQQKLDELLKQISGLELLEAAMASKRGVLLLVPHFGNWEYLALYLGRYDLVALYDPPRQTFLEQPLKQARERTGARLERLDRAGLRVASSTLKSGGLLGLLPDQVPDHRSGAHVPFFGHPALTMTLVHRLIQRHSPIVLLAAARRLHHGFAISFREVSDQLYAEDVESALHAMNQEIENLIAEEPSQYQWEYKRFKSAPAGVPRWY